MDNNDLAETQRGSNVVASHPPTRVYVDLTNACPMRCRHCYNSSGVATDDELSDDEVRALIDQVKDIGASSLIFSGGEPMARSGFMQLTSYACMRGLAVTIMTTGSQVTPESARALAQLRVRIKISLDGVTSATHDALRGQGAFAAALRGIRLLQSAGNKDLVVHYTVHQRNLQELSSLPLLLAELGLRNTVVGLVKPVGRARGDSSLLIPLSMVGKASDEITNLSRSQAVSLQNYPSGARSTFGCPNDRLSVTADGWVTPCAFLGQEFREGNLRQHPLDVIWRRHLANGHAFAINERCAQCPNFALAGGGCRARALYYTGDINAPDPYCCESYKNRLQSEKALSLEKSPVGEASTETGDAVESRLGSFPSLSKQMDRREFLRSSAAVITAFAFLGLSLSGCSTCGGSCSNTCQEACSGTCTATCANDCTAGCGATCTGSCTTTCTGG
jgi:radical SAM protein with 4Fe4S-binding SPASM domain